MNKDTVDQNLDRIVERLDRIVETTNDMQQRLDSLLKHLEKPEPKQSVMFSSYENTPVDKREDSNIMKKFNEWMLRKDPKNDMSTFDKSEGEEDNF